EDNQVYSEVSGPLWDDGGEQAAFLAVSEDYKDRWIFRINFADKSASTIDHLRDDAWIGGPAYSTFGWLPDGQGIYFVSERDGWAHLYTTTPDGQQTRQLTSGEWEIHSAEISRDKSQWYLT